MNFETSRAKAIEKLDRFVERNLSEYSKLRNFDFGPDKRSNVSCLSPYITHGVLSGEAVEKIKKSQIKNLVVTDTIDNSNKLKKAKNIEVLSICNLLGEAIKRISNSTSVSDLFK